MIVINPSDVQMVGIGLSAFLDLLLAGLLYFSSRHDRLSILLLAAILANAVWALFGFFYHITTDLWFAREWRVISESGVLWCDYFIVAFALAYLQAGGVARKAYAYIPWGILALATALTAFLFADLLGSAFVVGPLLGSPLVVLAPQAGPLMGALVSYHALTILALLILLAGRMHAERDLSKYREAAILFVAIPMAFALAGSRFTPWYGFDYAPEVGALAVPLFAGSVIYIIARFNAFNVQVVSAQLLVFGIWTFVFFRALFSKTLAAALPDIGLFVAVFVLGILLLRSVVRELEAQRELAKLTIEKTKAEFVTIAAHQLRTPLSALRWAFNLLLTDQAPLTKEQREIIEKGSRATDNMVAIANDLLNVARISNGKFRFDIEPGDVRDAVKVALGLLDEAAQSKHITLSSTLPPSVPIVNFDRGKLALAIENLIDNAIKYTPSGGSVQVQVEQKNGDVLIAVHDSGIGIPASEQNRLFEKFFRGVNAVHMVPDGSGLGLFIAKTIVDGHGGTLSLSSNKGAGTTATITLHLDRAKA